MRTGSFFLQLQGQSPAVWSFYLLLALFHSLHCAVWCWGRIRSLTSSSGRFRIRQSCRKLNRWYFNSRHCGVNPGQHNGFKPKVCDCRSDTDKIIFAQFVNCGGCWNSLILPQWIWEFQIVTLVGFARSTTSRNTLSDSQICNNSFTVLPFIGIVRSLVLASGRMTRIAVFLFVCFVCAVAIWLSLSHSIGCLIKVMLDNNCHSWDQKNLPV